MPVVAADTRHRVRARRSRATGLARHTFLGGNFFMLRMLNRYRAELGVEAPPQELERRQRCTIAQLQTDTAR